MRFAPTKAGTWSYVTTNNDTSDTGLHGKSGSISAVAYAGSLPLYLHGFVRSQPGHNLVYDDGTPFFWWSMDTTLIPDFAHVNDSNKTNWAPPVVHPNSQMYGIIDRAVQQKFNTLTAQLFYIYNSSGLNQHMVDTKFKAQYDPFFEYASSQGLSVLIQLPAHDYPNYRDHGDKKLVRYISARYGAYPVMYATTEPDIPDADLGYPQSTWLAPLNQIYAYLASIDVDGYRHPFGVWFSNTGVKKFANNPPTVYLDKPWANFIITQCGNMTGVDGPNEQGQQPISIYSFYYHNYPSLPMVEAGGCNWVKIRTNIPDSRQEYNAWRAVLSGSSGFGYGAEGIWDAVYSAGDASNCCQGWFTGISWKDAIDTPAGEYMKNIKNYIDNMPVAWYDTRPLYGEWVDLYNNPNAVIPVDLSQDWRAVARATSDFGFEMIYIPYSNQRSGYTGYAVGLKQASYTGSWYSAFDGSTNVISTNLRPQNGVLPIPQIPNNGPWIFTLNAGNPIPDTANDNGCHVQLPNGCPKDALYAAMGVDNKTFVDNIPSSDGGQCRLRSSVWYQYCGLSGSQSANTFFVEGGVPTVGEITNSAGSSHLRFINGAWVQSQD